MSGPRGSRRGRLLLARTGASRTNSGCCSASWLIAIIASANASELLFSLTFRGLDHDRARDDQWEINRWRVEAVIDQSFGNIEGADSQFFLVSIGEHDLVHTGGRVGQMEALLEATTEIIGIQNGRFRDLLQPFTPTA